VCGEERPDNKIDVYSRTATADGIEIKQNVRHCNDRQSCIDGASKVNWLRGPAHYELKREESNG